jgi:oligogalacturonide lyase
VKEFRDSLTSASILQVTEGSTPSHGTYFLQRSFLPDDRRLLFISHDTGTAQICVASLEDGHIERLTTGPGIHPFSAAQHPAGRDIVLTRGDCICAVDWKVSEERVIARCEGASIGECSISPDGNWLTAAYRKGSECGIFVCAWDGSNASTIPFPRTVIHPQFHPLEPEWIEFAGDPAPRMHRVRRTGQGLECLYQHTDNEFVVHETFLGSTGDLVFTIWPKMLCRMNWSSRHVSTICPYNAWHIAPNRRGSCILCDTNHPDLGIHIIDAVTGKTARVCVSESSNQGTQWRKSSYALRKDFEAARSAREGTGALSWMELDADTVYGPQRTHPHPSWSNDERKITFTSDRSGIAQVYVAELPEMKH